MIGFPSVSRFSGANELSSGGCASVGAKRRWPRVAWLLAVVAFGAWLRLDQFAIQVLTDDEWHALGQLVGGSPERILLSFGFADYSIPLTLLYWYEAQWFGLSELGMRWPMLSAGLLILILFPLRASDRLGWRVALLFALLLAISPMLVNYSRQARPYALTLLLGYLAHYAFLRYTTQEAGRGRSGIACAVCAALAGWLHLISLPFVAAPFLLAGISALFGWRRDGGAALWRLFRLGVPTALLVGALIGPPMLADPGALLNKSGSDLPNLDTVQGVWHSWLGTPSTFAVLVCLCLAALGFPRLWRDEPLVRTSVLGLMLTLALLLVAEPAWVHTPLAFARYLLPALPLLLLLAIAAGTDRLAMRLRTALGTWGTAPVLLLPLVLLLMNTPLRETLRKPNGNTLHSSFQADYRTDRYGARDIIRDRTPLSPWWETLRDLPRGSVTVAAAPYYSFSPRWDALRWEQAARQRVVPGWLTGLCVERRDGELPHEPRFTMRNAVYLADAADLQVKGVTLVVFQKPYTDLNQSGGVPFGQETAHCLGALRARFGKPFHEDDKIAVFAVNPAAASTPHDRQQNRNGGDARVPGGENPRVHLAGHPP